jgi:hypothetical protein
MAYKKKGEKKPNFKSYNPKKSGKKSGEIFPSLNRAAKRQTNKNHGTNRHGGGQSG